MPSPIGLDASGPQLSPVYSRLAGSGRKNIEDPDVLIVHHVPEGEAVDGSAPLQFRACQQPR